MFSFSWLVPGTLLSLFSLAYAEPVHLPLIRNVLPHSDSAVARSFLGVERRNRVDASLIPVSFGTPTQIVPLFLSFTFPGVMVAGCNQVCSGDSAVFNYTKSSSARNKSTSTVTQTIDVIEFGPFSVLDASFFIFDSNINVSSFFGLGFPSASFNNLPSLWRSLLSSNPVDAPEMGIWLPRMQNTSTSKAPTQGVFTIGGTNSSLYTGPIEFLNSTSTSAWALNITTLTIEGHELTFTQSSDANVIFENTDWIYGPTSIVATIWAQVPGASLVDSGIYQYPCSTTLNVSLSFGGRSWTLDPAELNGGTVELNGGAITDDTHCLGAIRGSDDQRGWIVGETFLRGVYTVLRQGNPPAIGFADLSEQAGGAPSVSWPTSFPPRPVSAKSSASSAVPVIGGVIGALVLCAALLTVLLLICRRRRRDHAKTIGEYEGGINCDLVPEPFLAVDQHPEIAPLNSAQRRLKRKLQENGASLNHPHRMDASNPVTQPGESVGEGENGASSPPAAAAADVSVMEELRNLREEMRRLAERDPGGSIAPPSYHPDA
ncbi:aspartic peptidase domain-containing protein [Favolaschia claudopus]|uniref:Aspartic peptidase domain-containing protein n=1 Tax=Favolaschia claudopus TaxID=2862362 RepID=A0AAW0EFK9_9AGAR